MPRSVARISLTFPALLESRALFLLIAGSVKRQVVEAALAGSGPDLPVRRVLAQDRVPVRIFWTPD